jgi:OOP family OmpA-OmpF porin
MTEPVSKPLGGKKPANDADPLDALKSLLLGDEKQQIEQISERLEDPRLRSSDLAEVLPDALSLSDQQGQALTDSLESPVTTCIQRRINRDPDSFADALYPVMGPAIRQSISATLKELVSNINHTLEHSLSAKGLKWRMEAMRSGVPFAEVVLRHTLSFRVEQVFLIQNESGLLMQHVQDDLAVQGDADAISGMLTAITQFVRDAFQAGEHEGLETVEIGAHTVLLAHGPAAYLACVVRGIPPSNLRQHCQEVVEQVHRRYPAQLGEFDGDPESLAPAAPLLQSCLLSEQKQDTQRKGMAPATLVILLLLLGAVSWGIYHWWSQAQAEKALHTAQESLVAALRAQPGVVITETRFGPHLQVAGLRDPLATAPASLLAESALDAGQVSLQFRPYLDVSPEFAQQRAVARLMPPAEVKIQVDEQGTLSASGVASVKWAQRASLLAASIPGINAYDDRQLITHDQYLLQQARQRLAPGEEVTLAVKEGRLQIRGQAPLAWIQGLEQQAATLPHLQSLDVQVQSLEQQELNALVQALDGRKLMFVEGTLLDPLQESAVAEISDALHRSLLLAQPLGYSMQVLITGRTDGVGSIGYNEQLALARALIVRDTLIQRGLPEQLFHIQTLPGRPGLNDPAWRHAELRLLLNDVQATGPR